MHRNLNKILSSWIRLLVAHIAWRTPYSHQGGFLDKLNCFEASFADLFLVPCIFQRNLRYPELSSDSGHFSIIFWRKLVMCANDDYRNRVILYIFSYVSCGHEFGSHCISLQKIAGICLSFYKIGYEQGFFYIFTVICTFVCSLE